MRVLEFKDEEFFAADTLRGHNQETVEIWERETMRTIRVKGNPNRGDFKVSGRSPKLVIDDAFAQTRVFIAKARAIGSEMDNVLREVMGDKRRR